MPHSPTGGVRGVVYVLAGEPRPDRSARGSRAPGTAGSLPETGRRAGAEQPGALHGCPRDHNCFAMRLHSEAEWQRVSPVGPTVRSDGTRIAPRMRGVRVWR